MRSTIRDALNDFRHTENESVLSDCLVVFTLNLLFFVVTPMVMCRVGGIIEAFVNVALIAIIYPLISAMCGALVRFDPDHTWLIGADSVLILLTSAYIWCRNYPGSGLVVGVLFAVYVAVGFVSMLIFDC